MGTSSSSDAWIAQVKLRGFRIEPAEIEARIQEHPSVKEAVVELSRAPSGERQIVAYAAPHDDPSTAGHQVAEWENVFTEHVYHLDTGAGDPLFNTTGWRNTQIRHAHSGRGDARLGRRHLLQGAGGRTRARPRNRLRHRHAALRPCAALPPLLRHGRVQASLDWVRDRIAERQETYGHVALSRQAAHELDGIEDDCYDAVDPQLRRAVFPEPAIPPRRARRARSGKLRRGGRSFSSTSDRMPLLGAVLRMAGVAPERRARDGAGRRSAILRRLAGAPAARRRRPSPAPELSRTTTSSAASATPPSSTSTKRSCRSTRPSSPTPSSSLP